MSSRSKRRGQIPPRPQIIPEQLRAQFAGVPSVLNRQQSMELVVMLAAQLNRMLNDDTRLPWVTSTIDQRSDGFSLHVQVLEPAGDVDAVVLDGANG